MDSMWWILDSKRWILDFMRWILDSKKEGFRISWDRILDFSGSYKVGFYRVRIPDSNGLIPRIQDYLTVGEEGKAGRKNDPVS